jgi:photosystem II stability/assembly factor-like uncharacterized protein
MITLGKLTSALFAIVAFANLSSAQVLTQTSAPMERWTGIACSTNGKIVVAVSDDGSIYISKNHGGTWQPTTAPLSPWGAVACSGNGRDIVACSIEYGIFMSHDGGDHWIDSMSTPWGYWESVTMSVDGRKIAAVDFYDSLVYRSNNSGASWESNSVAIPGSLQSSYGYTRSIAGTPDGTKLMVTTLVGTLYSSTDSGITWLKTSAPTGNWSSATIAHDGSRVFACEAISGSIYISYNFGKTWEKTSAPSSPWYSVNSSWDGRVLVAVAGGSSPGSGPAYTSVDHGWTWHKIQVPDKSWYASAMTSDGTDFYAVNLGGSIYQGHPAKNR